MILKALIFDVDGTLAETEECHRHAFNETFQNHGLDWHWSVALYAELLKTTGGKERISAYMRDHLGVGIAQEKVAALHQDKTSLYVAKMQRDGIALRPGIADVMARGRADGLKLAIATTTSRPNVDILCQSVFGQAADDVFDVIAAGDEVAAKKPAPDVYDLALARLGLPPEACIALEDSRNGVLSARAASLPVIACPSRYTATDDLSQATVQIDTFETLAKTPDLPQFVAEPTF